MNIPEGWPTEEMLDCAYEEFHAASGDTRTRLEKAVRAMLSAAPTPPACSECGGEYAIDSGGTHPWGEPALMPCPKCFPAAPEVEPVLQRQLRNSENWADADSIEYAWCAENDVTVRKLYTSPPSLKASWDAEGNPLNLEAAARDVDSVIGRHINEMESQDARAILNLRKFLNEEAPDV